MSERVFCCVCHVFEAEPQTSECRLCRTGREAAEYAMGRALYEYHFNESLRRHA